MTVGELLSGSKEGASHGGADLMVLALVTLSRVSLQNMFSVLEGVVGVVF